MKRNTISLLLIIAGTLILSPLSAANHLSVPVDHRVYNILESGRIRGLFDENLISVKPYPVSTVVTLLEAMADNADLLRSGEKEEIERLLEEFETVYGNSPSGLKDLFSTGYLRFLDPERTLGASFGIQIDSNQRFDLAHPTQYDSRNALKAILRGDIGPNISFNMDFGLAMDNLNPYLFLPNEFNIPGEGFYMNLFDGGSQPSDFPTHGFYQGLLYNPELTASFFHGDLTLRWGTIKRDWGPGLNNLLLSSTAKEFDAIELQLTPTPWFRYAFITGSLSTYSVGGNQYKGVPHTFPSDPLSSQDAVDYRFNNNYSAHRVELDVTKNLTFAIFEASVWQKRSELGYLNPLSILMFVQNSTGDVDSMFAGLDFSYTLPGIARFYGAMAMNEMNKVGNLITMLKAPRNMFAFQLGAVIPIPIGTFSTLTAQWTYINPFVYSHYPTRKQTAVLDFNGLTKETTFITDTGRTVTYKKVDDAETITISGSAYEAGATATIGSDEWYDNKNGQPEWSDKTGRVRIVQNGDLYSIYETYAESMYVNKGQKLGYPLQPNSQEFLLSLDIGLPKGWNAQAEVKYQARSGQYGFDIWQYMLYWDAASYPEKAFWDNTFQHTLSVLLGASKKLDTMPITLSASYQLIADWAKPYTLTAPDGRNTIFKDWEGPSFNHILHIGVRIYY